MGNQPSSSILIEKQTDRTQLFESGNPSEASNSSTIGHKTITVRNCEELKILKKNFEFRLRYRQYLAHLYGFEVGDNQSENNLQKIPCKSLLSSTKITLHYQKITLKFSDLYKIPVKEGAKLLIHCLKGFSLLLDHYGYFTPQSRHIFKQGQSWVVWVSDNIFSIKNQIEIENQENSRMKCKFWQKIIHLFDVLRDEQNPQFSYSSYVYGELVVIQQTPFLQFSEIIQKLEEINLIKKQRKSFDDTLKKSYSHSSSTVKREESKLNLSIDINKNDATLSKFNNNKSQLTTSMKSKHAVKLSKSSSKMINNEPQRQKQTNSNAQLQKEMIYQKQNFVNFKKVSSKLLKIINNNNKIKEEKESQCAKHIKNISSISTLTNCTGKANEVFPSRAFGNFNQINQGERNFMKKSGEMTVDNSLATNSYPSQIKLQPRKITQKSERNSDNSQKEKVKNNEQDYSLTSYYQEDEATVFGPAQLFEQNQSVKATSISGETKKFSKQSMQNIQQYSNANFKNLHQRSFTDSVPFAQTQNKKIKYCLSQQFDSEFFSNCSKKEVPFSSNHIINGFASKKEFYCLSSGKELNEHNNSKDMRTKQMNSEINISLGNSQQKNSEKQLKKVRISDQKKKVRILKDSILENSDVEDSSLGPKQASIAKLAAFKSQGGLKSLLGTKMNTLMSIKQIDVQVPIDEQILYDLNRMFPRHYFAKSTKVTK